MSAFDFNLRRYPVVYIIINWGRASEIRSWVWSVFVSWVLGLGISSGYRIMHIKVFTDPRIKVGGGVRTIQARDRR